MVEVGSSGNKSLEKESGDAARAVCVLDSSTLGPNAEGTGARKAEAELAADQGVFLCPCRTVGTMTVAGSAGCNAGNLSGRRGAGGGARVDDDDDPAARATRSNNCPDDCREE